MPISIPKFYEQVPEDEIECDIQDGHKSQDYNADELPFHSLGGRRFEVLSYLLEVAGENESRKVTLVKASGDKGRDLLWHQNGVLSRIIQCKNLKNRFSRPELISELVKLILFDRLSPFLPSSGVTYEIWAPFGLTEQADALISEWPLGLTTEEVLTAFQKTTSVYKTLGAFRWEVEGVVVCESLKKNLQLLRQDGIRLSQRVRENPGVYERFFRGDIVLSTAQVEAYLDSKLVLKVTQMMRSGDSESRLAGYPSDSIDAIIDDARDYINKGSAREAETLLRRVEEKHGANLSHHQRYRVVSNLGAAALKQGRDEEAAKYFLRAEELEPGDERAIVNGVFAQQLLRKTELAYALATKKLSLNKWNIIGGAREDGVVPFAMKYIPLQSDGGDFFV